MSDDKLLSAEEVGREFGKGKQWVQRRCAGPAPQFSHIRIGNTIRFTPEQFAEIKAKFTVAADEAPADTWGRRTRGSR